MTQSAKQSAQQVLDQLPEDADWERIMYELYVKEKIELGLKAVAEGRVVSQEEARRRLLGNEG